MRILPQDLKFDFPYEKVCIEILDSGKIFAQGDIWGAQDNYIEIAKYSTAEKAQKAMEMLHIAYCGNLHNVIDEFVFRAKNYDSRPELLKLLNEAVESTKYFKFPADDEIEV